MICVGVWGGWRLRAQRRTAVVTAMVIALGGLLLLGVLKYDVSVDRDTRLIDPAAVVGDSVSVRGVIEGLEGDNLSPWSAVLVLDEAVGGSTVVVVNSSSSVTVSPERILEAQTESPFPYAVLGMQLDGTAKRVRVGPFGLRTAYILESAKISHP